MKLQLPLPLAHLFTMPARTTKPLSVIRSDQFSSRTTQTPGSLRHAAISPQLGVDSKMWAGTFLVEPGASTGIHHHGEQDTIVYVLEGEAIVRSGEQGNASATVRAGDFLHVPAWLIHQEINPSSEHSFRWIVVRSTPETIVVNLPDTFWD